jgi:alpha-maltose-1-phosphate synthase
LVENATWHPREWNKMELEEASRFGLNGRDRRGELTESMLRRMEKEFENCDRIVVASTVALQSFAEYGYEKKAVMVKVGVDAGMFSPRVRIANTPPKTFRVCCVGRVEFAKGVAYLLEAWNRLRLPHAELVLVGEVKPQMKSLLQGCAERGVRLAGVLPQSEVARCYQESDAFVLPSLHEGFGLVLLEAMASGLPVVATDRTGAKDCIADGKEGLIVPARDAAALANAILWCYEHPEERAAMGRAARARIESEFTLEHYNERVIALYRNLAAAR